MTRAVSSVVFDYSLHRGLWESIAIDPSISYERAILLYASNPTFPVATVADIVMCSGRMACKYNKARGGDTGCGHCPFDFSGVGNIFTKPLSVANCMCGLMDEWRAVNRALRMYDALLRESSSAPVGSPTHADTACNRPVTLDDHKHWHMEYDRLAMHGRALALCIAYLPVRDEVQYI